MDVINLGPGDSANHQKWRGRRRLPPSPRSRTSWLPLWSKYGLQLDSPDVDSLASAPHLLQLPPSAFTQSLVISPCALSLAVQFDSINLKTRSLPKFVMECKRQNSNAFTIKIDITKSLVAYPNPISEETRIPPAMAVAELLEAADMFDFISAEETPLSLTPPQRQLRDILLKHAWTTLYCGASNGRAGRLVQGCKGVAKTTTFMMVQGILSTLLPHENLVFFASLREQPNVFETFAKAYAQRRGLDEAPLWQSFEEQGKLRMRRRQLREPASQLSLQELQH